MRLRGTGMAIRRDVALGHRFHAPASEDLFFTIDLLLDGIRCRHVDDARLVSAGAPNWQTFGGQKVRYEAGRMAGARAYVPRLLGRAVRSRDMACLEAAWFLATPPLGVAVASLLTGVALAAIAGAWTVAAVYGAGLAVLALTIVTGLVQAGSGLRTWAALAAAPWYVVWKSVVQVQALVRVVRRDPQLRGDGEVVTLDELAGGPTATVGAQVGTDVPRPTPRPPLVALAPADPLDPATFSGLSHRLFAELARQGCDVTAFATRDLRWHDAARGAVRARAVLGRARADRRTPLVDPDWMWSRRGFDRLTARTALAPRRPRRGDTRPPGGHPGGSLRRRSGAPGPLHHRLHGDPGPGRRRVLGEPGLAPGAARGRRVPAPGLPRLPDGADALGVGARAA